MNSKQFSGIYAFVSVVEHGSFTRAADLTGVSKANLSQHVSQLEKSLGVQLLHRTTRQLRPTDVGEVYCQRCREALAIFKDANEWVQQVQRVHAGHIQMNSVGGLIGEAVIAPLLIEFQERYPEIDVSLDFSSQRIDLLTSDYDLVLRMGQLEDSTLIARGVHRMHTRYVASPNYLADSSPIEQPDDLTNHTLIFGSVSEWQFVQQRQTITVKAQRGFQVPSGRVMCDAALSGLGVTRLADIYVAAALEDGRLVEVLPQWHQVTPISLVCPPGRYQLARVKLLLDWLAQQFPSRYQEVAMHEGLRS